MVHDIDPTSTKPDVVGAAFGDQKAERVLNKWAVWWELAKPRLSLLSVITVLVGYLAAQPHLQWSILIALTIGSSLAAGGCGAVNQWWERKEDAKMSRTAHRPLPSKLVQPQSVLIYGVTLCLLGDVILWYGCNASAAFLTLLIQISYLFIYTPLKKCTVWNTEVGAIPGALPPLVGWAAAEPSSWTLGGLLFALILAWQIPHFMALSWMFREDYAKGGFRMLAVEDSSGQRTARKSFIYTLLLVGVSLSPLFLTDLSSVYAGAAAILGLLFLLKAIQFLRFPDGVKAARELFLTSILYLPLLLLALVIDLWV